MRKPIELRHSYRLLNHGPTTLITSAHQGKVNVMAAQWVMPLDFEPPKLAAVISGGTYTRKLVDGSGELVVNLPTAALLDLTYAVGKLSGQAVDKFELFHLKSSPATRVSAPLLDDCVAWLECRVIPEPEVAERYDLLILEVLAAWANEEFYANGEWRNQSDAGRTLHHGAGGLFYLTGNKVRAKSP